MVFIGNSVNFSLDDFVLTSVNFSLVRGFGDSIAAYIFCFYLLFKIFRVVFIVSGDHTLPSSFRLDLFRSFSIGGCRFLHLFCVFVFVPPSWIIYCFYLLSFAIIRYSSMGFFAIFFLSLGFLPSGSLS